MKKKIISLLLIAVMLCCTPFALASEAAVLASPTDFVFDTKTGAFTFTSNDENAGYYFVRVYPVVNGVEATEYVASSRRVNAGSIGEKSGTVNVDSIGWGRYTVKLITFTASGTNYTSPGPVSVQAFYGAGGKLTRPEMMVVGDNNTVEVTIDLYSLSDYKAYQYLPTVRVSLYADEALTNLVAQEDVRTSELVVDTHPTGAYIWPYSLTSGHMNFISEQVGPQGGNSTSYNLTPEVSFTVDAAATYYVVAQAITDYEGIIESSELSEVIAVALNTDEPDYEDFLVLTTSLWLEPSVMGMPTALSGTAEGRVDMAQDQTTSSYVE